jgi:hypothetical protein
MNWKERLKAYDDALDNAAYAALEKFEPLGLPEMRSPLLDKLNDAIGIVMREWFEQKEESYDE